LKQNFRPLCFNSKIRIFLFLNSAKYGPTSSRQITKAKNDFRINGRGAPVKIVPKMAKRIDSNTKLELLDFISSHSQAGFSHQKTKTTNKKFKILFEFF